MFRINWKYLSFIAVLVLLYFVLLYFMPQRYNWFVTLHRNDKNPFGGFIFNTLISNSWISEVNNSNKSLFELRDMEEQILLVICEKFEISPSELEMMMRLVEKGKTIVVAAHEMDSLFTNALDFGINDPSFSFILDDMWGEDTVGLNFTNLFPGEPQTFWYPSQLLMQHFSEFDTATTHVLAQNTNEEAVLLQIPHGEGTFFLCSTPLVFSNCSMIHRRNHDYVAQIFGALKTGALHWTEYYQLGRMESTTPLRYILTQPALKWALYVLLISIVVFMIFDLKRKQRIIPVIPPLKNETVDFVKTISSLYYQKRDHRNLAAKQILHFTEHLKHQLYIDLDDEVNQLIEITAAKTNTDEEEVRLLFDQMGRVSNANYISSKELKILTNRINTILEN